MLSVSFIWIRCVLVEPLPALHIPRHRARAYRLAKLRSHARFITVSHEGQLIVAATNENVLSHFRLRPRDRSLVLVSPLRFVSTSRLVRLSLYLCDKHPEGQCCRPLCLSMVARARQNFGNAWRLVRDICFVRHLEARSVVEWTRNVQTAVVAELDVNASCFMCPWTVGRRRAHNISPFEM